MHPVAAKFVRILIPSSIFVLLTNDLKPFEIPNSFRYRIFSSKMTPFRSLSMSLLPFPALLILSIRSIDVLVWTHNLGPSLSKQVFSLRDKHSSPPLHSA